MCPSASIPSSLRIAPRSVKCTGRCSGLTDAQAHVLWQILGPEGTTGGYLRRSKPAWNCPSVLH